MVGPKGLGVWSKGPLKVAHRLNSPAKSCQSYSLPAVAVMR